MLAPIFLQEPFFMAVNLCTFARAEFHKENPLRQSFVYTSKGGGLPAKLG